MVVRDGSVAANVELKSGADPRIVVAFPAGNSAVALWFEPSKAKPQFVAAVPKLFETPEQLRGVVVELMVNVGELTVEDAILGSTRFVRSRIDEPERKELVPDETRPKPVLVSPGEQASGGNGGSGESGSGDSGEKLAQWQRQSFDGVNHYAAALEPLDGTQLKQESGKLRLVGQDGSIRFRLSAATDEPPLMPIASDAMFLAPDDIDPNARAALEFLTFKEKFLAGSWRYHTYFGRDTLLTAALAMKELSPSAIEAMLRSVLERLDKDGQVAHEEDLGDYAAWRRRSGPGGELTKPLLDYKMIDDNLLLPIIVL